MPFAVKINVALKEQNCQKIGSKRVKLISSLNLFFSTHQFHQQVE